MKAPVLQTGVTIRRRLSFRCAQCRAVALAQAEWRDGEAATVECGHCGDTYVLPAGKNRGASDSHYRDQIRALATAHELDLATATSVLEEIIPLSQAVARRRTGPAPAVADPPPPNGKWLRGSFACVAVVLSLSLLALKRREATDPVNHAPAPAAANLIEEAAPTPPEPVPLPREAPLVRWNNDAGNMTEIAGPDPASVLEGFCREGSGLELVAVNDAVPPNPGLRIGLVRRQGEGAEVLSVSIRRDPRTGRWFIGDRQAPVRLSSSPAGVATGSDLERPAIGGG